MALNVGGKPKHENEEGVTNPGLGHTNTQAQEEQPIFGNVSNVLGGNSGNGNIKSLTFGDHTGLTIMPSNQGSEYTRNIANALSAIYQNDTEAQKLAPQVLMFDKETTYFAQDEHTGTTLKVNPLYSIIVIATRLDNKITYFTIVLEATGREPMTTSTIIREYETIVRTNNIKNHDIYTADDCVDNVMHLVIKDSIKSLFKLDKKEKVSIVPVDGVILPKEHPELKMILPGLARCALMGCAIEADLERKNITDLNIQESLNKNPNTLYKFEASIFKTISNDLLGSPVRSDWKMDLVCTSMSNNFISRNTQNRKQVITRVGGFVDAIPLDGVLPGAIPPIPVTRLQPNIIVTHNSSDTPTPGYFMLGLLSAYIMCRRNMFPKVLLPHNPKEHVGYLNVITKTDNGNGKVLELTDKKYSADLVLDSINSMFAWDPCISVDIEAYGPETFFSSVFSVAASNIPSTDRENARTKIIQTVNVLTGGRFPTNFNPNEIFIGDGVVIPMGVYSSKDGERDIREIDLAFVVSHIQDPQIIMDWISSSQPFSVTGRDPFITKVRIIDQLIQGAEIRSKAFRITFTSKFIETFVQAVVECGFNVNYDPEITETQNINLSLISANFRNAGITNLNSFGRTNTPSGPNFQTNFNPGGLYRY